jgi:hypothetical protein
MTTDNTAKSARASKNEEKPALPPLHNQKLFTIGRRCGRLATADRERIRADLIRECCS